MSSLLQYLRCVSWDCPLKSVINIAVRGGRGPVDQASHLSLRTCEKVTDTLRKTPSSPDRSSHVVAGVADPDLKGAIFYKDPDPHARPKDPDPQNGLEPDFFFNILKWIRPSRVVRASDCQCRSHNSPGFNPSILRHSGIWGAADKAALNKVLFKKVFKCIFYQCIKKFSRIHSAPCSPAL